MTNEEAAFIHCTDLEQELYAACKAQHEAINLLFSAIVERNEHFNPQDSGKPWTAMQQGQDAMKRYEAQVTDVVEA